MVDLNSHHWTFGMSLRAQIWQARVQWIALGSLFALLFATFPARAEDPPTVYLCEDANCGCAEHANPIDAGESLPATYALCLRAGSDASAGVDCEAGTGTGSVLCGWQLLLETVPDPVPATPDDFGYELAAGLKITDLGPCAPPLDQLKQFPQAGAFLPTPATTAVALNWVYDAAALAPDAVQCLGLISLDYGLAASSSLVIEASSEAVEADMEVVSIPSGVILLPEPDAKSVWLVGLMACLVAARRRLAPAPIPNSSARRTRVGPRAARGIAASLTATIGLGLIGVSQPGHATLLDKIVTTTPQTLDMSTLTDLGSVVASAGDLDNDGVEDLVVGLPQYNSTTGALLLLLMRHDGQVNHAFVLSNMSSCDPYCFTTQNNTEITIPGNSGEFGGNLDETTIIVGEFGGNVDETTVLNNSSIFGSNTYENGTVLTSGGRDKPTDLIGVTSAVPTVRSRDLASLTFGDYFGQAVTGLGDLDGNGVNDLAVSALGSSSVWILLLEHTPLYMTPISVLSALEIPLAEPVVALTPLKDLDENGTPELLAGQPFASQGCEQYCGGASVLFLNSNGTVSGITTLRSENINDGQVLTDYDYFGYALTSLGDLVGDGSETVAIGSPGRGSSGEGAIDLLSLSSSGIDYLGAWDTSAAGFPTGIASSTALGISLANLGDLDRNGTQDVAVGMADGSASTRISDGRVAILLISPDAPEVLLGGGVLGPGTGPTGAFGAGAQFGQSLAAADIDGEGRRELIAGARADASGSSDGVVYHMQFSDVDGDHWPDFADNCPDVRNASQADYDGDGVGDLCDNCRFIANETQDDSDDDGEGDSCEATEIRLISGESDLGEPIWRLEMDCGAASVSQLLIAAESLGQPADEFSFGGASACEAPEAMCSPWAGVTCNGCFSNSELGTSIDPGDSGAFTTDANGDAVDVGLSGLMPNRLYILLEGTLDGTEICQPGDVDVFLGNITWLTGATSPSFTFSLDEVTAQGQVFGAIRDDLAPIRHIRLNNQSCFDESQVCSFMIMSGGSVPNFFLNPASGEPYDAVTEWDLCYEAPELLHRAVVGVKTVNGEAFSWQGCEGANPQDCAADDDPTNSPYPTSVPSVDVDSKSFTWLDDTTGATSGYHFLLVEGNIESNFFSRGALGVPDYVSPLSFDLVTHCVGKLNTDAIAVRTADCDSEGTPACDATDMGGDLLSEINPGNLPILLGPDDFSLGAGPGESPVPMPGGDCPDETVLPDFLSALDTSSPCSPPISAYAGVSEDSRSEDWDGDTVRDEDDNCVFYANADQADAGGLEGFDTSPEGTGDACQCGESTDTGIIESNVSLDASAVREHLLDPTATPELDVRCSMDGDDQCDILDAVIVKRAVDTQTYPAAAPGFPFDETSCSAAQEPN